MAMRLHQPNVPSQIAVRWVLGVITLVLLSACGKEAAVSSAAQQGIQAAVANYCTYQNVKYPVGSSVPSPDSCNSCLCASSGNSAPTLECTMIACSQ